MAYEDAAPIPAAGAQVEPPVATPVKARRFRHWRRTRPFWGGLFTMLGGLEVALIPLSAYKIILVSMSVTVATVTGIIIAILGLLMWLTPSQNKLYGLLAVLFGVVSFVTSNVGGFALGGILSIIGGALAFAWVTMPTTTATSLAGQVASDVGETSGVTMNISLDQMFTPESQSGADAGSAGPHETPTDPNGR
jgi:hypothetical protein